MAKFKTKSDNGLEVLVRYPGGGGLQVVVDGKRGFDSKVVEDDGERWFVEQVLLGNLAVELESGTPEPHPNPLTRGFGERLEDTFPIPAATAAALDLSTDSVSIAATPQDEIGTVRGVVGAAGAAEK